MEKLILMFVLAMFVATASAQVSDQAITKTKLTTKASSTDKKVKLESSKTISSENAQNKTAKKITDKKAGTVQNNDATSKKTKPLSTSSSAKADHTADKKVIKQSANDIANTAEYNQQESTATLQAKKVEVGKAAEKTKLQEMMKDENIPVKVKLDNVFEAAKNKYKTSKN
jgi:hypothetical protein